MGKWTLDYHDDVLREKFKSMVNGAINRAKLEKGEPTITYEAFVSELDTGDSFTCSLVDILVKELAERRARPNVTDRRLISERTAKSLQMQAAPMHVYRGRFSSHPYHSRFASEDHISPIVDLDRSDDEDDETIIPAPYSNGITSAPSALFPPAATLPPSQHSELPPLRVTSPRPARSALTVPSVRNLLESGGSTLTRHNSIRRLTRTRSTDFVDFTTRRRQARRTLDEASSGDTLRSEESEDGTWQFSAFERIRSASGSTSPGPSQPPRRFFPLAALTDSQPQNDADAPGPSVEQPPPTTATSAGSPSSSQLWYQLYQYPFAYPDPSISPYRTFVDQGNPPIVPPVVPPRLRRGGLRAPESMLPLHPLPALPRGYIHVPPRPVTDVYESLSIHREGETAQSADRDNGEGGHQLLTPRSNTPAEENA